MRVSSPSFPYFAGSRSDTEPPSAKRQKPNPNSAPVLVDFDNREFRDPLLQRYGDELLAEGLQHYIEAQDAPTQASARKWIRRLLGWGVNPNGRPGEVPWINRALFAHKPQLAALLQNNGAHVASPEQLAEARTNLEAEAKDPVGSLLVRNSLRKPGLNGINQFELINQKARLLSSPQLRLLKQAGIDLNQKDPEHQEHPALYDVAIEGFDMADVLQTLLEGDAKVDERSTSRGLTPLAGAAYHNYEVNMEPLFKAGANVHIRDYKGRTPLMWAAKPSPQGDDILSGDQAVELLVQHGANVDERDHKGQTAIFHAAKTNNDVGAVRCLIAHGANVNIPDHAGETALGELLSHHLPVPEMVDDLIQAGADLSAVGPSGMTPFSMAASEGNTYLVGKMVATGRVNPFQPDGNGETAIYHAAENGHIDLVEALLLAHASMKTLSPYVASINWPNHQGESPIQAAVRTGHAEAAELLYEYDQINQ